MTHESCVGSREEEKREREEREREGRVNIFKHLFLAGGGEMLSPLIAKPFTCSSLELKNLLNILALLTKDHDACGGY